MHVLVTGAAGFIGSRLAKRLQAEDHRVIGLDSLTDYYNVALKRANADSVIESGASFIEGDLNKVDLTSILDGVDAIFHLAGQPGVRSSWGSGFPEYTTRNIDATQRLLEACRGRSGLRRFVYASSSSIYGDAESYPTREDIRPQPVSPYGVTKLGAEHLCTLYATNFDVPTVSLRYFTVYGPHQRPDMAFHKWCKAALANERLPLFGTGEQSRDFTYIDDAVQGTVAAITADNAVGETINIGGGERISVNGTLDLIAKIHGAPLNIDRTDKQKGDVQHTAADVTKAKTILGFEPKVSVADGLREEYAYIKALYDL